MHIPDGFINAPTSIAGGVIAAGLIAVSIRKAGTALDDRDLPLAGLVAAFVFAVQMLNFPVAGGTSGHLLGGCLAAVLVGPWVGSLALSVVFIVQALVFADGGLTALGLNIIVMGYATCFVGYGIFRLLRLVLPRTKAAVGTASGLAAWCGVVAASLVFTAFYAIGGAGGAPVGTVALAMVGVHMLIGIGEGVITALTVGAVLATRPDLVFGARDLVPTLATGPPPAVASGDHR